MSKILSKLGLRVKRKTDSDGDGDLQPGNRESLLSRQGPMLTDHESVTNPVRSEYLANRVLTIIVGVLATTNIITGLSLVELIPMHTVEPYLVTFQDSSNQIVTIAPPTARLSSMSIIIEKEVREYMTMRYEVLPDKENNLYRWNTRMKILSSNATYSDFQREISQTKDTIDKEAGYSREIVIRNVLTLGSSGNTGTYQVDFDLIEKAQATGLSDAPEHESHYTAILKVGVFPQTVPRSLIGLNPFGFKVIAYKVAPRRV